MLTIDENRGQHGRSVHASLSNLRRGPDAKNTQARNGPDFRDGSGPRLCRRYSQGSFNLAREGDKEDKEGLGDEVAKDGELALPGCFVIMSFVCAQCVPDRCTAGLLSLLCPVSLAIDRVRSAT